MGKRWDWGQPYKPLGTALLFAGELAQPSRVRQLRAQSPIPALPSPAVKVARLKELLRVTMCP